jgi:3',5'-cyclic AMP phosphodiesterase CpdA
MATGELGGGQAAALASRLIALGRQGMFRVVLIHHAPVSKGTDWHRRLVDRDLFAKAIAEAGAELILHGHNHKTSLMSLPGRDGDVPVVGVAAASVMPHSGKPGGSYCLFSIEEGADGFTCDLVERAVVDDAGTVATLKEQRLFG